MAGSEQDETPEGPGNGHGRNGGKEYNGKLKIPLPFDDAVRAALEVKPPEKAPRKPRAKRRTKS